MKETSPPPSRTISWPAATSTARERMIVTIPSSRALATWHSVTAIVPSARRRCDTASSSAAAARTQRGSADSMPSSSSLPSGLRRSGSAGSSITPSSHAPSPRRAVHSSSGP